MEQKAIESSIAEGKATKHEKNQLIVIWVLVFFIAATLFYYALPNFKFQNPLDDLYVQMVIFLFATLVGFTVSRQNNRYREIIKEITAFDGSISAMYREFSFFGKKYQNKFVKITKAHYGPVIENHRWDWNISHPSTTLSEIYKLIKSVFDSHELSEVEKMSASEIKKLLAEMQKNRKDMIALYGERIQMFQWFVIYFLCIILVITISSVSSQGLMLESILKAAFVTAVFSTAVMLRKLDNLDLFESFIGERSAKDIFDIIEGNK